jgi:hypothetical protein
MRDDAIAWGLEKLNEAAWALHDLLYLGDEHQLELRRDLPTDVTMELVGILHLINFAEKKIGLAAPERVGSSG